MPITGIPMRLPTPFELPAELTGPLVTGDLASSLREVVQLALQTGCGDVVTLEWPAESGGVRTAAAASADPAIARDLDALLGAPPQPPTGFTAQALSAGTPTMVMGQVEAGQDPGLRSWGPRVEAHVREAGGNVGFVYVVPIGGPQGGALTLHRWLSSGPLNHDQPAIAAALAELLARRLPVVAGQGSPSAERAADGESSAR